MEKLSETPIIPKRPQKSLSMITKSEESDDGVKKDQPVIPRRPQKLKTNTDISTPVIPARPKSKKILSPTITSSDAIDTIIRESDNESKELSCTEVLKAGNHINKSYSHHSDDNNSNEKLNSELEQNSDHSDFDGEKTPGNTNTKITFKDSVDSLHGSSIESDDSEFNDDLETVSQEKEYPNEIIGEYQLANKSSSIHSSIEENHIIDSTFKKEKSDEIHNKSLSDNNSIIYNLEDSRSKDIIENTLLPSDENNTNVTIEAEDAKKLSNLNEKHEEDNEFSISDLKDETNAETLLVKDDLGFNGLKDKISTHDKNIKNEHERNFLQSDINNEIRCINDEIHLTSYGENIKDNKSPTIKEKECSKDNIPSGNNDIEPKDETKRTPVIPNRPNKKDYPSIQENKLKPPPPKPKKLSSKIAAFQQMFNQEQTESANEIPNRTIKRSPIKLSSDKQKFAESLKGVMGMPFPGVVNPLTGTPQSSTVESKEEVDSQYFDNVKTSSEAPKIRRAKGPRGKKLPKALKEPVNIQSNSKFTTYTSTLWEFKFSKDKENVECNVNNILEEDPVIFSNDVVDNLPNNSSNTTINNNFEFEENSDILGRSEIQVESTKDNIESMDIIDSAIKDGSKIQTNIESKDFETIPKSNDVSNVGINLESKNISEIKRDTDIGNINIDTELKDSETGFDSSNVINIDTELKDSETGFDSSNVSNVEIKNESKDNILEN